VGWIVTVTRRQVLKTLGAACAAGAAPVAADARIHGPPADDAFGVLVDTAACIGCRKCEWACNQANHLPVQSLATFEDTSVFARHRRPDAAHYTVVNRFPAATPEAQPIHVKVQCMHCVDPACASACLVSALVKQPDGAVTYEPWRCMGCRYCMVACPFGIPAYEYHNPTTPRVRKCSFCHERVVREGRAPACVEICPTQCLTFGPRNELVRVAHRLIDAEPDRYENHVYGETEAGGGSWLYLASVSFEELAFPTLGESAPPQLTETLQHGLFRDFIPPLALFGVLGAIMALFRPESADTDSSEEERR
jgi:Fe-S-cluster-containing dehydrogenase component